MKRLILGFMVLMISKLAMAQFVDERTTAAAGRTAAATGMTKTSAGSTAAPLPPTPKYMLRTGEPVNAGVTEWAEHEGWMLMWYPSVSWTTLRETKFDKPDVVAAITEVIDILRDEGKPVQLRVSDGNRVIEVLSTAVRQE